MFEAGRLIAFINFLKIPVNVGYYRTRLAYIVRIIWIVLLPYAIFFKDFVKVSTGKKKKELSRPPQEMLNLGETAYVCDENIALILTRVASQAIFFEATLWRNDVEIE